MKHIILEGVDGAGKTTYLERLLRSDNKVETLHFGAPEDDGSEQFDMYARSIYRAETSNATIIWDRSFYSDMIYGPAMRDRLDISRMQLLALESMIVRTGGGMILYLTASVDTCWKRCQRRGETYIKDRTTLAGLHERYAEFMKHGPSLPVFRIDTTK